MKNTTIDLNDSIIKEFVESLRPQDKKIREQLDTGYSYDGKIAILYDTRPVFDMPGEKQDLAFAKIRFYKSRGEWHLYWMRANGKWESYEPFPKSTQLHKILKVIKEDNYGCFFG